MDEIDEIGETNQIPLEILGESCAASVLNVLNRIRPLVQHILIILSTSSERSIDITVELEEEKQFFVELNKRYILPVSVSEPRYYFYKFNRYTSDIIIIDIDSNDEICLTVSVQDVQCPVFDSNKDIKYEGIHHTISNKGAIAIKKSDHQRGFFIVFVAKPDNSDCIQKQPYPLFVFPKISNFQLQQSNVTFVVRNGIETKHFILTIYATSAVLLLVGILLTVSAFLLHRYGTLSNNKYNDVIDEEHYEPMTDEDVLKLLQTDKLTVKDLSKFPKRTKQQSYNYMWHTLSIAIFYSIPVVQLVITYQGIELATGNQDMCYYNFLCAHPAFGLNDFNHAYSNIGYIIFGTSFIFAVHDRHRIVKFRKERGIPVHYGMLYALGLTLVIEGFLSACYHICPSQANYQFDTSFMYVLAVLCIIVLYQNRHPDVNVTAYTTYVILGGTMFLATVGILKQTLFVWVIFVTCYSMLVSYLTLKIYFLNHVLKGLSQFKDSIIENGFSRKAFRPIRRGRFISLVLVNVLNYSMVGVGMVYYVKDYSDFGTFLLELLAGNAVIHLAFYVTMKLVHKEKLCSEAIFYGVLGIGTWLWSGFYFFDMATLWSISPAQSRQWNQKCTIFRFFDTHDLWHLVGAIACYFSLMFIMCLDDDIIDRNQSEIPVF